MKKLLMILTLMVGLFFGDSALAQEFEGGFSLGANFSQVDGDAYSGYNKLGLHAGMYVYRSLDEDSRIQLEVLFSQKGSKKRLCADCPNPGPTYSLRYHYVEVPVLYYRQWGPIGAHVGSGVSLNVIAKEEANGIIIDDEDLNRIEIPLHLGASYRLSDRLDVFLRHSYSLLRAGNPQPSGIYLFTQNGLYNRVFTLGVRFGR